MANIKQQKKRNRRSLEQRDRNLRYRSTIKTLFRRLDEAAEGGDGDQIGARARELEHLIDRAAAEGVIHRNNAARKKSRVARITQKVPHRLGFAVRRRRPAAARQREQVARRRLEHQPLPVVAGAAEPCQLRDAQVELERGQARDGVLGRAGRQRARLLGEDRAPGSPSCRSPPPPRPARGSAPAPAPAPASGSGW